MLSDWVLSKLSARVQQKSIHFIENNLDVAPKGAMLDHNSQPLPARQNQKGDTMQAITTKFFGPTNTLGSRIKATCWLTSIIVSFDHSANTEENHTAAIEALVCKLNNDRIVKGGSGLWNIAANGESVDGKGKTAIIELV